LGVNSKKTLYICPAFNRSVIIEIKYHIKLPKFMRNYEVTFIVDPVLSGDDVKGTAQKYVDLLTAEKATIVHINELGLRQLAYPINKRQSGLYYCVEFEAVDGAFIGKVELALRRDEKILRYLTVALDKFGVKYNADKRSGKIGVTKKKERKPEPEMPNRSERPARPERAPKPERAEKAPEKVVEPVV
jgi:small subunit ribosomal protein S6